MLSQKTEFPSLYLLIVKTDNSDIIKPMNNDNSTDPCQGANYKSPRGYTYTVTDWFPCNKAAKGDIVKRNVNRQQEYANLIIFRSKMETR